MRTDYHGGPPRRAAHDLIPAAASTYGGWHPAFAQWWRGAVRMVAELAGPSASQTGMLWRTVGFLSVRLQRQNFQTLTACAPALRHAVEGRLGRPLSEDPEFWRAAPEAALQWSAEEFGFPDPRRGDDPLGTDRFYHASSAAGHTQLDCRFEESVGGARVDRSGPRAFLCAVSCLCGSFLRSSNHYIHKAQNSPRRAQEE